MKRFIAYTDGYFDMNSQVGSSACVILSADGVKLYEHAKARRCEYDPEKKQRNNEQELGAIIRAVMSVPDGCELYIYSDSQYAVNVLSGTWNASANLGLIDRYNEEVKKRHLRVQLFWVKGHANGKHPWNEYADELCGRVANIFSSGGGNILRSSKNLCLEPCVN